MRVLKKSQERTEEDRRELSRLVQDIIDNVRANKDEALKEYGRKFDARENKSVFRKTKLKKRMHSYQKKKSQI